MKKRAFLLIAMVLFVACMLAFSISANEVEPEKSSYYLVQSLDSEAALALQAEGKTNIVDVNQLFQQMCREDKTKDDAEAATNNTPNTFLAGFADGATVEFILAENIVTNFGDYQGVLISTPITVAVRYNGYTHYSNGGRLDCFVLSHKDARLELYGTKSYESDGSIVKKNPVFTKPTVTNGAITAEGNLDICHDSKVYAWIFNGSVYVEGVRAYTKEELVYCDRDGAGVNATVGYSFKDCVLASSGFFLSMESEGRVKSTFNAENCCFDGMVIHSVANGSRVVNTSFLESSEMDCWNFDNQSFEFEDCTFGKNIVFRTKSGRTHLVFRDCIFEEGMRFDLNGDGGGDSFVRIYKSATCTEAGSLELKRSIVKGTANPYEEEVNNYNAPALGHKLDIENATDVLYEGYLVNGKHVAPCLRCGDSATEEDGTAKPLFTFKGYSTPEDGSAGLTMSFEANLKAIEAYEAKTGEKLSYGVVAAAKSCLGDKNPLDENGNEVTLENGNVVKAEVSKEFCLYDFRITNMEGYEATELVLATYIIVTTGEGEEATSSVVYLQDKQLVEGLGVVSYDIASKKIA